MLRNPVFPLTSGQLKTDGRIFARELQYALQDINTRKRSLGDVEVDAQSAEKNKWNNDNGDEEGEKKARIRKGCKHKGRNRS